MTEEAKSREELRRAGTGKKREEAKLKLAEQRVTQTGERIVQAGERVTQAGERITISKGREGRLKSQFETTQAAKKRIAPEEAAELVKSVQEVFPNAQPSGFEKNGTPRFRFDNISREEAKRIADSIGFVPRSFSNGKITYGPKPTGVKRRKELADIEKLVEKKEEFDLDPLTVQIFEDRILTLQTELGTPATAAQPR